MEQEKCLISQEILKFYEKDFHEDVHTSLQYFKDDLTLDLDVIHNQLFELELEDALHDFQYEDFLQCYKKLKPVFNQSVIVFENADLENLNLQWLGSNFKYLISTLKQREIKPNLTDNVEGTLLITAMLEYALGSVYYTLSEKHTPPHLLRDLLNADELKDFFGYKMIAFLKILLCTPKSINLRNIVWHGFPRPNDIPNYYVVILMLVIHTLGLFIKENQLNIIYRAQVDSFTNSVTVMQQGFITKLSVETFRLQLDNSSLLSDEYKEYWYKLLEYFQNGDYLQYVILNLTQIELILRLKYSEANQFDVSAKLDEYYITMDSIFEQYLPNVTDSVNVNKLLFNFKYISEDELHLMYDLFVAQNGPRLRDKVSHGEISMDALNEFELSNILFSLSFNLLTDSNSKISLEPYESKFHLNCRAKNAIIKANFALDCLVDTYFPQFSEKEELVISESRLEIFLRPKNESTYMLLVLKISKLILQTSQNYQDSIKTRQKLLAQHELRSRRRRTFENLLGNLPAACTCLYQILKSLEHIFKMLIQTNDDVFVDEHGYILRFLKGTLKIAENFIKYSNKDSNEWIKTQELCKAFTELYKSSLLFGKK